MESPPPYKKKSNTGLIIGLIIGAVVVCCIGPLVAVGGLGWWGLKTGGPMITCAMAIDDIQTALREYAKQNNGKLPNAKTWQTDITPFYKKAAANNKQEGNPFGVMPAEGEWGCEDSSTKTGFAFNSDLSGKKLADIDGATIMVFEVPKRGMNLNMPYKPQDVNASPKIMSERRGWFVAPVEGDADLLGKGGKRVRVNARGGTSVQIGD